MKRNLIYSFIGTLVASILFLGIVVSDASAQMTVTDIQAAIKAKGASWVAGENPISRLTPQEKKNLVGLLDDPKSTTHPAPTCQLSTVGLPPSIDWRNNGGNYVSAVKNQGMCSSCWAYASTAAAESAVMIANKTPNANLDLMEAVLISCCANCSSGVCRAGYLGPAADYLQTHGEPLQSCPATDCGYSCPNQEIKSWEWITPSVDNIKAALANYGPLVTGMQVYSDFYNYMSGVYSYAGGSYVGGHAVAIVGYQQRRLNILRVPDPLQPRVSSS
jgi:C1A family cysteine protease